MPETSPEPSRLSFAYAYQALVALVVLVLIIGGLAWWDRTGRRERAEVWRERFCAELPRAVSTALNALNAETSAAPREVRDILPVLRGMTGESAETWVQTRVWFQHTQGLREVHAWDQELSPPTDLADDLNATSRACEIALDGSRTRLVRRLKNGAGVPILLIVESEHR